MMLGGGAEIPENRLVVLRQQREAVGFVLRPGADVRRGEVAHIVHVEAEQRAHLRFREQRFRLASRSRRRRSKSIRCSQSTAIVP